jgi:hypothetical protein
MKRVLAVSLLMVCLCGCSDFNVESIKQAVGITQAEIEKADTIIVDLTRQKADLDERIAAMPDGDEKVKAQEISDEYGKALNNVQMIRSRAVAQLEAFATSLQTAEDEIDVLRSAGESVIPLLPAQSQPYGALALMGLTLVGAVWKAVRNGQRAKAGEAVALAIEKAKGANNTVNFADDATKRLLSVEMGPAGKALVNKVQGK